MAEVVDSIIVDLIARDQGYVDNFDKATAAHGRFKKSIDQLKGQTFDLAAEGQKYKGGLDTLGQAEEQATVRIGRTRRTRADAALAADKAVAASAKTTADVEIAEAERASRAKVRIASTTVRQGTGALFGATVAAGGSAIPNSPIPAAIAAETVVAEKEINHALADQAILQAGLTVARGKDRDIIRDQITEMRLFNQLVKAGYTEEQATIIAEERLLVIETERAKIAAKQGGTNFKQLAEGVGLGRIGGSSSAVTGLVAGVGLAVGGAAIASALSQAKEIEAVSKSIGITVEQLQIYQQAAAKVGVSNEQLQTSFGQLANNLGRAQDGSKQQAKEFAALGIDVKAATSAGDLLPTLIDRISSIKNEAQRAAVETALFGEAGRKLDPLLSGGNQAVSDLAKNLIATGAVLSSGEIQNLNRTAGDVDRLKAVLAVDISKVVDQNAESIRGLVKAIGDLLSFGNSSFKFVQNLQDSAVFYEQKGLAAANPFAKQFHTDLATEAGLRIFDRNTGFSPSNLAGLSSKQPAVQGGAVDPKKLAKAFAPDGPKGKSVQQLAREAEERTKRFNDELAQSQEEQLRAQASLTGDIVLQAQIEDDLTDRALRKKLDDIESERKRNILAGADAKLENARAEQLKSAAYEAATDQKAVTEQNKQIALAQAATQHAQTSLGIEADLLNDRLSLAQTAKERLAIELQLLENARKQKENDLKGQIAALKPGDPKIDDLQKQLNALPAQNAIDRQKVQQQNLGPLAAYIKTLPDTADKLDEAFQQAAANGLQNLNDGLTTAIGKFLHLHGIAGQFLEDIIKIGLEHEALALFNGGSSSGGFLSSLGSLLGIGSSGSLSSLSSGPFAGTQFGASAIPGLAGGGSFTIGGNGGIDNNLLSINGQPVVRVNQGETINVVPANQRVAASGGGSTIVHQTFALDLRGGITTPELIQGLQNYTDQVGALAANAGAQGGAGQALRQAARPTLPRGLG